MKAKAFKLFLAALLLLLIGSGAAFADGSKRHYQPGHGGYYHQKGADHYRDRAENNPHMEFKDGVVRWLRGIPVASIAKVLAADPPTVGKIGCDR